MNMGQDPFDEFILHQMPDFVAVNYHRALQAKTPRERVERYLHLYTLGLRAPAIILVSQYLLHDRREVRDAYLNDLLWNEFPHLTLDVWQKILFAALRTYHDKRDLFFMPELYDFYWDADTIPHRRRPDIERPFSRLTQIGIELTDHEKEPRDENGWTALADEVEGLVQGVLHSLSFLSQYDLIRVVGQDAESYSYEVHRGLDVTYGSGSLEPSLSPQPTDNWFYLRSEQGQLLELHPLFVFWNVELPRLPSTVADLGLYDRLLEARLRYILIQEGGTAFDANRVQDFNSLLFDTIQRVKKFRQESEHLTWGQLLDICKDISRPRMASVSEKFRPKLYVQRDAARREFERFLASDRKCFVLIGRSGVGKSNFLLALQDEVTYTRDDVCVLLYDGAQLSVGATFESTVARDFDQRISIGGKRLIEVWREIDKCEGIAGRQVILCVDAVNESTQATDLLRQLNELVQQDHPWLKVVFSSRPETWQAIRKGVILADALYYRQQDDTFGVTLAPFSFSQRLDEFSRIELVEAYAKHREVFDLQTAYEDLSAEQKEVLREPLNLYFIARSNQHGAIPSTLRASTLIEQYVEALLESQRLELDDLRLLEKQLLPLMVRDGHYSNAITSDDLDAAGEGLFEAIYSPQLMSDGHARNESFMRLMDAEILVSQRSGWNPRTAFKYERFYEYFAGRRILEISTSQLDREEYFSSLAMLTSGDMRTPAKPYLWGAVRNAMVADAVAHGMEVLENLCRTDQQRVKELMVDALTSLGVDHLEQVKILMRKLLPPTKKRSSFGRIRQLATKQTLKSDPRTRNARKIAVEVASNLELSDVLRNAALHVDPTTRTTAIRYVYRLWRRSQEMGFNLLEQISEDATPGLIPDSVALESTLGLSLVIFFDHFRDTIVLKRLQLIWHSAIGRLLGIDQTARGPSKWLRDGIRQQLYEVAISLAFRLLRDFGELNPISMARVEAFFRLPLEQKQLYRRLVGYLDVNGAYSRADVERDYLAALSVRNFVFEAVAELGISARLAHDPSGFLPFVQQMFAHVESDPVPSAWRNNLTYCLASVLDKDPSLDDVFDFFMHAMERCQIYYAEGEHRKASSTTDAPDAEFLGHYIVVHYERAGTVQTPWLTQKIESARERHSAEFFKSLIESHLPQAGIEKRKPQAALDALSLVVHSDDTEIIQMASTFLAHLRTYYPDEVDSFLEDEQMPEVFRLMVHTSEPEETVGELIGFRVYDFLLNDVVLNSPELRAQFSEILATAAECNRMREWVGYLIPEVVNRIYGSTALRAMK